MDAQTWKEIWFYVFYLASGLFYLIVVITAAKGMGDVKEMIQKMIAGSSVGD